MIEFLGGIIFGLVCCFVIGILSYLEWLVEEKLKEIEKVKT
jgi:hypothetical protein